MKLLVRYSVEYTEFGCECCGGYHECTLTVEEVGSQKPLINYDGDAPMCWDWADLVEEVKKTDEYKELIERGIIPELFEDRHNNYI